MSIAITDDHQLLAGVAADFLARHAVRTEARQLLTANDDRLPTFWPALVELGWLGLHVEEAHGGSGYGLLELLVVVEQLGRELAPGPFVPTAIASATLARCDADGPSAVLLPSLVDGSRLAGVALEGAVTRSEGSLDGSAVVLGAELADLLIVPVGDDLAIVERGAAGLTLAARANIDPTRRLSAVTFSATPATIVEGGARALRDVGRVVLAAEAVGIAHATTEMAADYAKVRQQFGRVIATFQAVKHHCANMIVAAELATAAVWTAAQAAGRDPDEFSYASAMAADLAVFASGQNTQLNIQVHGGIGFTWEHDAHLYVRRASAIDAVIDARAAAAEVVDAVRRGVRITRAVALPPEAETFRAEARAVAERVRTLDEDARVRELVAAGYAVPHWPRPWGRAAGAIEQLVIEEEFKRAGIGKPNYGITAWVILTLVQHATDDQVARWVRPALDRDLIWCQLFSEPDAGSDAAGVTTRATRTDGGWLVNGQKVWTSGAHVARFGLATVRTDPDVPKHQGITTMVIDLESPGVEIRPLTMPSGMTEFNEVFFDDVFVPDDDVVGPVDNGWTVARATLGNESVSIGGGGGGMTIPVDTFLPPFDAAPDRLTGGAARLGRHFARVQAIDSLNVRSAQRAVAGGEPGPEGAISKLVLSDNGHEATAILFELAGPEAAFLDGPGFLGPFMVLMNRALSIAGGTSEIKRNQIGERILGLPRDPLIN